jgi:CRP/FNR family cyclic AMP-dependent transcriptional regulator
MTDSAEYMYGDLEPLGSADQYMDEILEMVHQIDLFEGFNQMEVSAICQQMKCYAAPGNYILLQEGMAGAGLVLVLTGAVQEIAKTDSAVTDVVAGTTLGEASFIDGKPNIHTYIATVPMDFAVLSREGLNAILLEYPRLGNKLLLRLSQLISGRLRDASRQSITSIA